MQVKVSNRVIAYLLDVLFVFLLISLISDIKFINPTYDKLNQVLEESTEFFENLDKNETLTEETSDIAEDYLYKISKYNVSTNVVSVLVIFGYFVLFQKYNNGQTLGKKIMKIKVIGNKNKEVSILKYVIRILPMFFICIGNVISIIIDSIVILFVKKELYFMINSITIYIFLFIGILTFVMFIRREDNRGLHDILANTLVVNE